MWYHFNILKNGGISYGSAEKYCTLYRIVNCYMRHLRTCLVCYDYKRPESSFRRPVINSGGVALLLTIVTCGIYGLYWAYKCGETLDNIKTSRGIPASNGGVLYLILYLFAGIITYALVQNEINKLVQQ